MICPGKPKCSNTSHKDVDATVFCPSCNKFFCESCDKTLHEVILRDHQPVPISDFPSGSTIITGKCGVPGHHSNPLEYYCKDHNVPCCAVCLCIKDDVGKHSKCQTVPLKDMEQHMKSTMDDVIKKLEDSISNAEVALNKIKGIHDENEKVKNEVVKQIKADFDIIREAVDKREKELLESIEELWGKKSSCEKIIDTVSERSQKAKQIIAVSKKKTEKEWNTNHLSEISQYYGLVIDTTKELIKFCNDIDEVSSKDLEIRFSPEKEGVDTFIDEIKKFGSVFMKPKLSFCMKESPNNKYILEGSNKLIIRKVGNDAKWDCTAIGSNALTLNKIIKWDVKIVSTKNSAIMVGVAPFDIDQVNTLSNYNKCGWYFYCCYSTLHSGPPHRYSSKPYGQGKKLQNGDVVSITMNTQKGELSFSVNGNGLGMAFNDIPLNKPLVQAIEMYDYNDSVEIVSV